MKVSVVNLGCKVNRVESDTIAKSYENRGAQLCEVPEADLVVVNTCTVTEEADKKTRKSIRRVLRQNGNARVVVTGCAAAIDPEFYRALDKRIYVVDKMDLLEEVGDGSAASGADLVRVGKEFPTRVSLKVQDGCNHSCTYCIVHVARGRAWSRPASSVVEEAVALADAGVKEIVLTGIDLGSYSYVSEDERIRLGGLLRLLLRSLDEAGHHDVRLRIGSIEPRSLDNDFLEVLAQAEGRICRHLHLPLQSGSDKVLAEMSRPYTARDFAAIAAALKERVGDVSLTTDIIVGFPGETEQDFAATCALAREVGFTKIHVFRYSRREGTPAAARSDQIPSEVKERRAHELSALGDALRAEYEQRHIGSMARIAVEQDGWGMTESYYKVKIEGHCAPGSLIDARLKFGGIAVL